MTTGRGARPDADEAHSSATEAVFRELSSRTITFNEAVAEQLGLNATDRRCLDLLEQASHAGAITAGRLSELTGLTSGAITGVLDRLERAGYVKREKGPEDRRQVQIHLVPERAQEMGALFAPLSAGYAALTSSYTPAQLAIITEFIRGASALLARETERLRGHESAGARAEGASDELSAPLSGAREGQFELTRGATNLNLGSLRGSLLYRLKHQGPAPRVSAEGGHLHVEYQRSALRMFAFAKQALQIDLNDRIPWQLSFKGGAHKLQASLKQLKLTGVELRGGASHVSFELPAAQGLVPLRISGGAQHLRIARPRHCPLRIAISGGVNHLSIDTLELGAAGGTVRWQSPAFEQSSDGYDVQISGGANHLVVTEL